MLSKQLVYKRELLYQERTWSRADKKPLTYNSLKWIFKQYDILLRMSFCRKIYATFLRTQGIEQEIIDLLQGRIPRNVFVRHYYRPNFAEESNRVSKLLSKLYQEITP
jgi:intergrase/recombinase